MARTTAKLTERHQRILVFLGERLNKSYLPSIREIGEAAGISSTSVVTYYLKQLEEWGYIERDPKFSRALQRTPLSIPRLNVFLCHASEDKTRVRKLFRRLVSDNIDAWLDEEKLLPGHDWEFEIRKAVHKSDIVIICLSNQSITKEGYVQKEIKYALDIADEKPEGAVFLIPVRLEKCEVPNRLSRWQWVDLYDKKGYDNLLHSLQKQAKGIGEKLYSLGFKEE